MENLDLFLIFDISLLNEVKTKKVKTKKEKPVKIIGPATSAVSV